VTEAGEDLFAERPSPLNLRFTRRLTEVLEKGRKIAYRFLASLES
jgi:hypothetical protein